MKYFLTVLLTMSSMTVFADEFGKVDANELRDVLKDCRLAQNEARCLRGGILELIRNSESQRDRRDEGEVKHNLVCRSAANGKFAVYDSGKRYFVDKNYGKTALECKESIKLSSTGFVCSVGPNLLSTVRRLSDRKYLSKEYAMGLDDCTRSILDANKKLICVGEYGKYVRYDLINNSYLDKRYTLSYETCDKLINL